MSETPVPALPDQCWPVDTSCVEDWDGWRTPPDPDAVPPEPGVPIYTDAQKARAIALATTSLRRLTGYSVGGCPVTVRPCSPGCGERTWRTYRVGGGGGVPWTPVLAGGSWLNIGCGCRGGCGCLTTREVRLPLPAGAVTEVIIDGIVLDPSAYRLDTGGRLVRTDGGSWPMCQRMDLPDTEPGTWSVTYTPGAAVDGLAAYAAGVLAGQFVKACAGGECDLPSGVQQVARQGVVYTLAAGTFPDGKTGVREVDAWIESVNPNGLVAPSMVWSPETRRGRVMLRPPTVIESGGGA